MASKMKFGNPGGLTSLLKDGYKHFSGLEEAILRNIEACKQLAAITRTSLGPASMNKLVVNHLDRIFVTSDAATIVQELEVAHPAARMLTLAAKMQEQEQGDGTNLVLTFAGELLTQAESLLRLGVHPSEIIEGYKKAADLAFTVLDEIANATPGVTDVRDKAALRAALKPVIASKHSGYEHILSALVADALAIVLPPAPKKAAVNVDNVRVAKLIGGTVADSQVLRGVVVQRDTEGSIKHVEKAKIAVFGCSVEASSPETRGTVVIKTAEELKAYNKGEERMMEEAIKGIADSGECARSGGAGVIAVPESVQATDPMSPYPRLTAPASLRLPPSLSPARRRQGGGVRWLRQRDRHALLREVWAAGDQGALRRPLCSIFCSSSPQPRFSNRLPSPRPASLSAPSPSLSDHEQVRAAASVQGRRRHGDGARGAPHARGDGVCRRGVRAGAVLPLRHALPQRHLGRGLRGHAGAARGHHEPAGRHGAWGVGYRDSARTALSTGSHATLPTPPTNHRLRCTYPTSPNPTPQERAVDDAVNVAKALAKDGRMVPGAGACEMALASRIAKLAAATPGLEQYAIGKYAEALEVVPRVLAESSGLPASDVVSALYAAHAAGETSAGVDVDGGNGGVLRDAVAGAVCDAAVVKASALRLASEVAITVLRVDTIIMAKQAGGPKPKAQGNTDSEE